MSGEEQRRKAALAQLTVDNSGESGPPKPIDLKTTIEKEKEAEDYNEFVKKLRNEANNKVHVVAFSRRVRIKVFGRCGNRE